MMTDETVTEKKAPAKKRKKAVKKAAPTPAKADGIYTGMTVSACCHDCNVDGCVISGKPYCAHPRKGGLHSAEKHDNVAMRRSQAAERILAEQMLDVRKFS